MTRNIWHILRFLYHPNIQGCTRNVIWRQAIERRLSPTKNILILLFVTRFSLKCSLFANIKQERRKLNYTCIKNFLEFDRTSEWINTVFTNVTATIYRRVVYIWKKINGEILIRLQPANRLSTSKFDLYSDSRGIVERVNQLWSDQIKNGIEPARSVV